MSTPQQQPSPAQAAALVAVARSSKLTGRAALLESGRYIFRNWIESAQE